MDRENDPHAYNGILSSATKRNEIGLFVETWMDLVSVIQNEAESEREKQIY